MSHTKKLISLVIPAYREEKNISLLFSEIQKTLLTLSKYDFEIIFVNDGSPDKTWFEIEKLCNTDERVKGVNLSRNFGHQAALSAWYKYAKGDAIVSMDADLQHPLETTIKMIWKWEKWFEVVYARVLDRSVGKFKKHSSTLYYKFLSQISDTQIPRNVGDFRLIDKKVLKAFLKLSEKDRYIRGMFAWLWFKHTFVDFKIPKRIHWDSSYTLKKMSRLAMDGILNFSMFPLRMWFLIGVFMIILSFVFIIYMIFQTLMIGDIYYYQLYKWISVAGFWVMGLQFIFMWIMWEYIWRIYNEVRDRPLYVIDEIKNIK